MATVVSHYSPDLDSLCSTWITLRFGPHPDADLAFVGAGQTLDGLPPDARADIIHVDTGLGKYDHHQPEIAAPDVCAAKIVARAFAPEDKALAKLVDYVVLADNGRVPPAERQMPFNVLNLIAGLNLNCPQDAEWVVRTALPLFDAWYAAAREQVAAEAVFERYATWFESPWGKGVAVDHEVGPCQSIAYARGAVLFLYQSDTGRKGFNADAGSAVDLSATAEAVVAKDPVGTWYLHPSKKMLLNGSKKNPDFRISPLTLPELVDFVRAR